MHDDLRQVGRQPNRTPEYPAAWQWGTVLLIAEPGGVTEEEGRLIQAAQELFGRDTADRAAA